MDAADDSDTANPNRIMMTARCPVIQQRCGTVSYTHLTLPTNREV